MKFKISGQIKSGKNNMIVLRNGRHIPKKDWQEWRNRVVPVLKEQMGAYPTIGTPCSMTVNYIASENRRRDVPGMLDAIFHCFERAEIVKDDSLIKNVVWNHCGVDEKNAGVDIEITGGHS